MDSARSPGRSTMHTGSGIYLVVEVDDGTKHGMGVGMSCARGQSGRSRRAVRPVRVVQVALVVVVLEVSRSKIVFVLLLLQACASFRVRKVCGGAEGGGSSLVLLSHMPRLSMPRLSRPQSHSRPLSQSHPRPLLVLWSCR